MDKELEVYFNGLHKDVLKKQKELLNDWLVQKDKHIILLDAMVDKRDNFIEELNGIIGVRNTAIDILETMVDNKDTRITELELQLTLKK